MENAIYRVRKRWKKNRLLNDGSTDLTSNEVYLNEKSHYSNIKSHLFLYSQGSIILE